MKTLTLTQPWASLVAIGAKRIETRSWYTAYRGPLAIHAAKGFPRWAQETCWRDPFDEVLRREIVKDGWKQIDPKALPLGKVLATCRLVDCKLIVNSELDLRNSRMMPPEEPELSFGDYSVDRYAWLLEDIKALPSPDPAKGALSLWEWDADQYWKLREDFGPNGDATTPGFILR